MQYSLKWVKLMKKFGFDCGFWEFFTAWCQICITFSNSKWCWPFSSPGNLCSCCWTLNQPWFGHILWHILMNICPLMSAVLSCEECVIRYDTWIDRRPIWLPFSLPYKSEWLYGTTEWKTCWPVFFYPDAFLSHERILRFVILCTFCETYSSFSFVTLSGYIHLFI